MILGQALVCKRNSGFQSRSHHIIEKRFYGDAVVGHTLAAIGEIGANKFHHEGLEAEVRVSDPLVRRPPPEQSRRSGTAP